MAICFANSTFAVPKPISVDFVDRWNLEAEKWEASEDTGTLTMTEECLDAQLGKARLKTAKLADADGSKAPEITELYRSVRWKNGSISIKPQRTSK